jgi:hypothetical protein
MVHGKGNNSRQGGGFGIALGVKSRGQDTVQGDEKEARQVEPKGRSGQRHGLLVKAPGLKEAVSEFLPGKGRKGDGNGDEDNDIHGRTKQLAFS